MTDQYICFGQIKHASFYMISCLFPYKFQAPNMYWFY